MAEAPSETLPEERVRFIGIRRRTAEKMVQSARTIPHVSHFDEADLTELEALREELKGEAEKRGVKLSPLAFVCRALCLTLPEYPALNAVLDEEKSDLVLKKYYNLGIAVSAPTGLYVPVVKRAESKDVWAVAAEIGQLAAKVRENKVQLSDLSGGTFTVTNIGPIGGLFATPIILHPQTGILGLMKMQPRPVVRGGQVVIRTMMNLVLSFDHRVLDGAEAARFTTALIKRLEAPRELVK